MKITIVGAGVVGLCCAYYLDKEGFDITVIDRNDITDGCSFGNMGYISPSHFIPLASPGIISQGLKWMLSSSSPFYIKPRFNWELIQWGLTFWKNSNAQRVNASVPHLNNLLQLSRDLMTDLKKQLNDSFSMIERGCWTLYQNEKTGDHEKHLTEQATSLGLKTQTYTGAQVQELESEVEVRVAGGVLWLDDCHLDSAKLMKSLHRYLRDKGVKFVLSTEVKGFERTNGKINSVVTDKEKIAADEIIVANGSWMPAVARMAGIHLLMQPGKGYSVVYENIEKNLYRPAILVEARTAMTPIERRLRIGGTMELSGHSDHILPKRVAAIYDSVKKYFPSLNISQPDPKQAWYGYRPVTPDGLPYIGKHKKFANLTFAGGHAMLGVSAAAATGKLVNEIIGNRPTSIDIFAFEPERFS
jgi:D-amino-acid dehydrogenase